jgi:hypothetical protein
MCGVDEANGFPQFTQMLVLSRFEVPQFGQVKRKSSAPSR